VMRSSVTRCRLRRSSVSNRVMPIERPGW
jgi:hypothetical protein